MGYFRSLLPIFALVSATGKEIRRRIGNSVPSMLSQALKKQTTCNPMNVDEDHEQKVVDKEIEKPLLTCWRVEDFNLRICPSHFNLEHNTHITVIGSTAPILSKRISEFARIHSIVLKYGNDINDDHLRDNHHGCRLSTYDGIIFEVGLWKRTRDEASAVNTTTATTRRIGHKAAKHNNKGGTDTNSIMVEARKMSGDSLGALNLRRKLFSFLCPENKILNFSEAKANSVCTSAALASYISTNKGQLIASPPQSSDSPSINSILEGAVSMVSTASNLIKSGATAAEVNNGMDLLDYLSGTKHINTNCRSYVNSMILTGVDPFGNSNEVMDLLYKHAVNNTSTGTAHRYAVKILGSALFDEEARILLTSKNVCYWNHVVPILLQDMKNVDKDLHLAYFSGRCLRAWVAAKNQYQGIDDLDTLVSVIDRDESKDIVARFEICGREKYFNLEIEAMALFEALKF